MRENQSIQLNGGDIQKKKTYEKGWRTWEIQWP